MPSPTAQWFDAVATYGWPVSLTAIVAAAGMAAGLVLAAAQMTRALRRVVRHRRVARELARVHDAAYRERFGAKGRLV